MSDKQKKRYYWLKLKEDFFEEDTIEWLEEQPNGKEYCLFYLKLCLKSLKTGGVLARNVGNMMIPYDPESLAKLTNSSADTVRVAMDLFQKIGLIQLMDSGEIYLSQLDELVGSETEYAKQKRLQRSKDKMKTMSIQSPDDVLDNNPTNVGKPYEINDSQTLGHCPENVAQSIELEIDIELEKEIELQQHTGVWSSVETFQKLWLFPNDIQKDFLVEMIDKYSDELVDAAIKIAGSKDVPKNRALAFVEACLTEWTNANVRTVEDAREYTKRRATQSKQSYGRPVRKETLPEWAENPQFEDDKQVDQAVEARLHAYLEKQKRERLEKEEG